MAKAAKPTRSRTPTLSTTTARCTLEWLAHYLFDSIEEVQAFATRWLWSYYHERPNMALSGVTPQQKLAMAA